MKPSERIRKGMFTRVRNAGVLVLVVFLFAAAMPLTTAALAVEPDEMLKDPVLEARARALSKTLRCMVCQNESIDDSNAPLARDLRILIRERIQAGDSDATVRDFLVARYGEFILLEPRFNARTLLLWAVPFLVIVLGGAGILLAMRGRRAAAPAPLSEEEQRRLKALTGSNNNKP